MLVAMKKVYEKITLDPQNRKKSRVDFLNLLNTLEIDVFHVKFCNGFFKFK
jgi:hypothetical protein